MANALPLGVTKRIFVILIRPDELVGFVLLMVLKLHFFDGDVLLFPERFGLGKAKPKKI